MNHASYEIGVRTDDHGRPLVFVDGKLFGTVQEVKDLIAAFEANDKARDNLRKNGCAI